MRALTDGSSDDCVVVGEYAVYGLPLDAHTRCVHWHTELDVVAVRFPCCDRFYPCRECHDAVADHDAAVWPAGSGDVVAVMCGACACGMTIDAYISADSCGACGAAFNPGCAVHRPFYFA